MRYSCTSEQKKALNIPLLQKNLYELGAFYVADIEAESTIDITNRGLLSEESDPRLNLKKWLEEKTFKNPDKIVELAEPIIAEAMKQSTTAEIHGVFKPVSISVRNYRNYKEESFDFSDISFCTINGVNIKMQKEYWIAITKILTATRDLLTKPNSETSRYICRFDVYRIYCSKLSEKDKRRYKIIKALYISKTPMTIAEISKKFSVSKVTVYEDIKIAKERLSSLFFGIDGLKFF